jgi:hypothetical protein
MKNKYFILIPIIIALGLITYWNTSTNSTEKEITTMLNNLSETISFITPLHSLEQIARSKKLYTFFSEVIQIEFPLDDDYEIKISNHKEIQEKSLVLFSKLKSFELTFKDLEFSFTNPNATVQASVFALGEGSGEIGKFLEVHKVDIVLVRENSKWLIEKVIHLSNLRD